MTLIDSYPETFQRYYAGTYPERTGAALADFRHLSSGWESDIFAFTAQWTENGTPRSDDQVIRLFAGDAKRKAADEFGVLQFLRQAGYPVPRVDRLELEHGPEQRPFILMEQIHGQQLWPVMFKGDPEVQQRNVDLFCGLLARLHALDAQPYAARLGLPSTQAPYAALDRLFAEWQAMIDSMPPSGFQAVWEWLLARRHTIAPMPPALIHWDFGPMNILIDRTGAPTVIDWSSATINDPRIDIAWSLILMTPHEGPGWRPWMLESYQRQRGVVLHDLEFFEVMMALRRLFSVTISLSAGAERLGMRPGAEAEMRRYLPHLRVVAEILHDRSGLRVPEVDALFAGLE